MVVSPEVLERHKGEDHGRDLDKGGPNRDDRVCVGCGIHGETLWDVHKRPEAGTWNVDPESKAGSVGLSYDGVGDREKFSGEG